MLYMARIRPDLQDHKIPTAGGNYLRIDPDACFPAELLDDLDNEEFNCEIELGFTTYRVSSIDLEFL